MCNLPLFYPTTTIKNCCWWLRQLLFFGVVWQDCQSFPTCTLHPRLTSQWQKKPPPSLQRTHYCTLSTPVLKHSRTLHYTGLTIVCSSTHRSEILVHYPHAQDFPGFGLTQRARSRALSSTICCEGPFTFSVVCSPYRLVWPCNFLSF